MGGRGKLGLALAMLAACGCSEDADRLGRVCQKVSAKFDGVTEGMRGKLQSGAGAVRGSVIEASLDSRVALRLRWDKDMAGAEVEVVGAGPGVVELHGTVADLRQRRRAVELASTTVGVENVIDKLTAESGVDPS
jgi:osmotically-inducible protein OsmY